MQEVNDQASLAREDWLSGQVRTSRLFYPPVEQMMARKSDQCYQSIWNPGKMLGLKNKFKNLVKLKSPSKATTAGEGSQAGTDADHSKAGPHELDVRKQHVHESDYAAAEDRRLLRRSRKQVWVWRCVSYLLLGALIGEGQLHQI